MRETIPPERHLTDLSVKCLKELEQGLRDLVKLERCRSFRQIVIYLLETMLYVAKQRADFHLKVSSRWRKDHLKGQIRASVSGELYSGLAEKACGFGMEVSELVRIFLQMALDFYEELVPTGEVLGKEELGRLIIARLEKRSRLEDFRQGLMLIWRALVRR